MPGRLFLRLSILMFMQYFVWGSWYVTAGTYLLFTLEFSGREVGLVYGSSSIAAICSPFIIGLIADRYFAVERVLMVLQILGAVMLWFLSELKDFTLFYPAIIVYMLIFIPSFSLTNAICFQSLDDAKTQFPKIRVWGTVAWIVAGVLVSLLQVEYNSTPLKLASVTSFLLAMYSYTLPRTQPPASRYKSLRSLLFSDGVKSLLKDKGFRILILCLALICIPGAYYYSFVNPFLNDMGVKNAAGKMAVGQFTEILLMLALPILFRHFRLKWIIAAGLFCWGFRYLILSIAVPHNVEWLYMIAIALHGPAYVLALLTAQILIDVKVPSELRSTAQGFFSLLTLGLGAFVGAYIAGETITLFTDNMHVKDWNTIWMIPAILGLLVTIAFVKSFRGLGKAK